MRRILWLSLALGAALLLVACGSGGEEEASQGGTDGLAGEAPPVASASAAASAEAGASATATAEAPVSDLSERLDEMTLDEDDVPRGLSPMGDMTFDYDMNLLGVVGGQGGKAHMTMFAGPGQKETVVSMAILLDDQEAVEQALDQMDKMTVEEIKKGFGMAEDLGGLKLIDWRALDVSDVGDAALGFALIFELPQLGEGDGQWVFFGRGPLLAMTMSMSMGAGAPADAVTLAETMDGKIKDVILQ
jgi:predicted Zn-dependent protease with MMP-like domain